MSGLVLDKAGEVRNCIFLNRYDTPCTIWHAKLKVLLKVNPGFEVL